MAVERLDLGDGQWADIRTSPTHRQNLAIAAAFERAAEGRATYSEWASIVGRQLVAVWSVRGEDGALSELDDEAWGDADPDIVDAICTRAQELWREWSHDRRPKVTSPSGETDGARSETSESSSAAT